MKNNCVTRSAACPSMMAHTAPKEKLKRRALRDAAALKHDAVRKSIARTMLQGSPEATKKLEHRIRCDVVEMSKTPSRAEAQ